MHPIHVWGFRIFSFDCSLHGNNVRTDFPPIYFDAPAKFPQHNFVRPHSHGSILSVALFAYNFALITGISTAQFCAVLHDWQGTAGMFEVALFVIGGSAIGAALAFLMGA
jgi:hypothetical protein